MNHFPSLLFLGFLACASPTSIPELGDRFELPSKSNFLMVASAQTWPYQETTIDGIRYDIATNDKHRVAYIATRDPKFRTPEGLAVGATLEQVRKSGTKAPWPEPGWAYHTQLPSGWSAAFVVGRGMTDGPLAPNSTVSWFFKRK